jgi:hypothetical protein
MGFSGDYGGCIRGCVQPVGRSSAEAGLGGVLFIESDSGAAPLKAAMFELGAADRQMVKRGPVQRFQL